MKRAAYYARVSTARQEQEETIDSQVKEVEERIKQDGNVLLPHLKFVDDGWSGELLARPALDKLRDSARKREFEVLYVYDRGRLARKFAYQELVIEELTDIGIDFITMHDINAITAEEKVMQSMQGVFHEYERVKIAERMRRGKLGKTRDGKLLGYNPPFGYNYVLKTRDKNGYFTINEDEADVVGKIFYWFGIKNYSMRSVIKKLYETKIFPRKRKREFWTKGPIIRLLKNESYIGRHYYYKSEAVIPQNPKDLNGKYKRIRKSSRKDRPKDQWILYKCPRIIDDDLFYKAQKQLELNRKYANRNKKHDYLLRGLVFCTCGTTRSGQIGGKNLYYRCASRIYNYPLPSKCHEPAINAGVLDDLVWEHVIKLVTNKERLVQQANRWLNPDRFSDRIKDAEIGKLELELAKLDNEEKRYLQVFGAGLVSFDAYEQQMKDLKARRERLRNEISEQKERNHQANLYSKLNIGELCENALEKIQNWDFPRKEQLVRKIIDKIRTNQQIAVVKGFIPLEYKESNVAFKLKDRNCRAPQRGKIHLI
jgi:site-specific DNA recombinase